MIHVRAHDLRVGEYYRFDHLDGEYRAAKLLKLGDERKTAFVQFVGDDGSISRIELHQAFSYAEIDTEDLRAEVIRLSAKIRILAAEIHDLAAALGESA